MTFVPFQLRLFEFRSEPHLNKVYCSMGAGDPTEGEEVICWDYSKTKLARTEYQPLLNSEIFIDPDEWV